jgi:hypothetical protein
MLLHTAISSRQKQYQPQAEFASSIGSWQGVFSTRRQRGWIEPRARCRRPSSRRLSATATAVAVAATGLRDQVSPLTRCLRRPVCGRRSATRPEGSPIRSPRVAGAWAAPSGRAAPGCRPPQAFTGRRPGSTPSERGRRTTVYLAPCGYLLRIKICLFHELVRVLSHIA